MLGHETGNERDVAREPVELGDDDRAFAGATGGQSRGELGPPIQRVRALACLDLDELGGELESLGLRKALDGYFLGFDSEP